MKKIMFLIMFLCIISLVYGAELHGNIYDIELDKAENVLVEIGGQRYLSKDGSYSFELDKGEYTIKARKIVYNITEESAVERIIVKEGDNVYDLFLFPVLDDDYIEIDVDVLEDKKEFDYYLYLKYGYIVLAVLLIYYLIKKRKKKPVEEIIKKEDIETDDLDKILEIIKKQGGRITQKDIRKEMPYSEAKISLMITELEHKGKVERIKKGRGNIIILKQ